AKAECNRRDRRPGQLAVCERKDPESERLDEHAGDDQRLAPDAVGPSACDDLADAPDGGIERGDEADLADTRSASGEVQRYEAPGEGVIEVVDQARLRARAQRRLAPTRQRERLTQRGWPLVVARRRASLLLREMGSGVADEQKRQEKCEHGDDREGDD